LLVILNFDGYRPKGYNHNRFSLALWRWPARAWKFVAEMADATIIPL
jgi:hypothetical protein